MKDLVVNKKRYDALDGLRAYSSLGIVLMHVLTNGGYMLTGFVFEKWIPSFTNLVFLFMAVSSFSMCCGYYDKIVNNKISVAEFYSKRYAKIWPFFALLSVLDFMSSPSKDTLYEVFANLTLCFGLLPEAEISVIGVGWFLGLVFVFYLVFPFFCYLLSDKRRAWFSFLLAFIFNYLCTVHFTAGRENIVHSAVYFFAGGLIFLYKERLCDLATRHWWLLLVTIAGLATAYYTIQQGMLALFTVMLIYGLRSPEDTPILCNPVTKFLSSISMEVYLSHMVVFRVMEKLGTTKLFASDLLSFAVTSVGTTLGTIVFSIIVKQFLERLSKYIKKHFK